MNDMSTGPRTNFHASAELIMKIYKYFVYKLYSTACIEINKNKIKNSISREKKIEYSRRELSPSYASHFIHEHRFDCRLSLICKLTVCL